MWQDVQFGIRCLWKDRRFSILAIIALALGIGSAAVIFSVTDSVLFEPYPYKNQDRLTVIFVHDRTRPKENGRVVFSVPEMMDLQQQNHVFESITGYRPLDVMYRAKNETEVFRGAQVTYNRFDVNGSRIILGRAFTSQEDRPGAASIFCMSEKLWASQFNRDPNIVGRTFVLNGEPMTLVGVVDTRYIPNELDLVMPMHLGRDAAVDRNGGNVPLYYEAFGTLKRGTSLATATADLDVLIRDRAKIYPKEYPNDFKVMVRPLTDLTAGQFKGTLYLLMGAVGVLFLIACSNVANLLLARATIREREIAIRSSLGATRGRIIRQLLVESLLLSAGSCAVGCLFAFLGLKGVANTIPRNTIPTQAEIALHPVALWFALGVTILTTVLCGLIPAIRSVSGSSFTSLAGTGKGVNENYRHGNLRAALVIAEVALSILLLGSAGLMIRTLFALEHVDLGFSPANILYARVALPPGRYGTAQQKSLLFRQTLQRVMALPGVTSASESIGLPPLGAPTTDVTVPGKTHSQHWDALVDLCSEGYFQTLGLHLMRGRLLSETDVESARHVTVINEVLARNYFSGEDPIGKTIKFNFLDQLPDAPRDAYFEIIGIVGDFKNQGVEDAPMPEALIPPTITGIGSSRSLLVRTTLPPLTLLPSIRQEIWKVDSSVAVTEGGSIESYLMRYSYAGPQFELVVLGCFAGIGLLLVAIGVFSVMAYTVSLQTHEIGVRMALGAQRNHVHRMVLKKGLTLIATGTVAGLLASFGTGKFLANQIWRVSATDPWTLVTVVAIVVAVGLAACFFLARRATRIDPMVALRYE